MATGKISYKVEAFDSKWYGNSVRWPTKEQAQAHGKAWATYSELFTDFRVVESEDPPNRELHERLI